VSGECPGHAGAGYGFGLGPFMLSTVHEVGHLLGLRHAEYEGTFEEDDRGIMGWAQPDDMCSHDWCALEPWEYEYDRFSNKNMGELRTYANPWP
jgi:hypothetical protein